MMIPSSKLTSNKEDFDRLLPQNSQAEEAILGGIMLDPNAIYRVSFLPAQAFNFESHRYIYKACLELHRSGRSADLMTVATYLSDKDKDSLDRVGGQSKLVQLVDRTVSAVNIDQYANLVLEKYLLREIISAANAIRDLGFSHLPQSAEEITQEARALLEDAFAAASVLPPATEKFRLKNKNFLDLEEFLPSKYAKPLKQLAKYYPCPEELCLHSLWAPIASICNPNTNILVRELNGRPEFPIVRTMLISESSNRKSDIERTFLEPLQKIQEEWDAKYQQELADYDFALTEWEALPIEDRKKRRGEEPIPPTHRFFIYTEGTKEGVQDMLSRQPGYAILWAPDEILAAKTSQGEYKGGRGSDQESNLSSFNGQIRTTVRKGRVTKIKDCSSLMGGIQPMALPSLIKDIEDYRGELARYLPLVFDTQPFIVKDDFPINLTPLLKGLYEQIIEFPAQDFIFSSRAKRIYLEWQNSMEIRRYQHPSAGVRAFLGKIQGYCAKIAMELHLIWEAADNQRTPAKEVPADKIERAIKIVDFYIEQYFKIRQLMGLDSKDPVKDAIFERLKILGTVTRSNLSSVSRIFRNMKDSEVIRHFREIADSNPDVIALERSTRGVLRLKLLREDVEELNYNFGNFDRELEVSSVKLSSESRDMPESKTLSPPSRFVKIESEQLNNPQSNLTNLVTPVKVQNQDTANISDNSLTLDTQTENFSDRQSINEDVATATSLIRSALEGGREQVLEAQAMLKEAGKNWGENWQEMRAKIWGSFTKQEQRNFSTLTQPPTYVNGAIARIGDRIIYNTQKGEIIGLDLHRIGLPEDRSWMWWARTRMALDGGTLECNLQMLDPDNDGDRPDDGGGQPSSPPDSGNDDGGEECDRDSVSGEDEAQTENLDGMAVSLWQPWASLLATPYKQFETRSWKTDYRGKLIIHAAKKQNSELREFCDRLSKELGTTIDFDNLSKGCAIASAELTDCIEMTEGFISQQPASEIACGEWKVGRFAWKLENVHLLPQPIPLKGQQGLWKVSLPLSPSIEESSLISSDTEFAVGDRVVLGCYLHNVGPGEKGTIYSIKGKGANLEIQVNFDSGVQSFFKRFNALTKIVEEVTVDSTNHQAENLPLSLSIEENGPEVWEIEGFRKGDRVRLKSRSFFKGEWHQWPNGELVDRHSIGCILFDIKLPSGEIIRESQIELDLPLDSQHSLRFGSRIFAKDSPQKQGTLLQKTRSAVVLFDGDDQPVSIAFSKISPLNPENDKNPFFRSWGIFQKIGKGTQLRAGRHLDHLEEKCTNKIGKVVAKRYCGGKFEAHTEDLKIFNLEAVKVL